MILHSDYIGACVAPVLDILADPSVRVWVPSSGWVTQSSDKRYGIVPLVSVERVSLRRWMTRRARMLDTSGGVLVLVHRNVGAAEGKVGLFHDSRTRIYRDGDDPLNTHLVDRSRLPHGMRPHDLSPDMLEVLELCQKWVARL